MPVPAAERIVNPTNIELPGLTAENANALSRPPAAVTLESGIRAQFGPGVRAEKLGNGDIRISAGDASALLTQEYGRTSLRMRNNTGAWETRSLDDNTARIEVNNRNGALSLTIQDKPKNGMVQNRPVIINKNGFEIKDGFELPQSLLSGFDFPTAQPSTPGLTNENRPQFTPPRPEHNSAPSFPNGLWRNAENLRAQPAENTADFSRANATKIFNQGFDRAKEEALRLGIELKYGGSGNLVKGVGGNEINPIEIQDIFARPIGSDRWVKIGNILPEKNHLTQLFTSEEIYKQVKDTVNQALQR